MLHIVLDTLHTLSTSKQGVVDRVKCFLCHRKKNMSTMINNTHHAFENGCSSFLECLPYSEQCRDLSTQITFCTIDTYTNIHSDMYVGCSNTGKTVLSPYGLHNLLHAQEDFKPWADTYLS